MANFRNYGALTEHLARAAAASVPGAKLGFSNQSCSAYVSIGIDPDEDGDCRDEFRLRFSDHGDRHGADMTIRIDGHAEEIRDEDGDYAGIAIMDHHLEDLVAQAVAVRTLATTDAAFVGARPCASYHPRRSARYRSDSMS